jgi:hypothetical protein
MHSHLQQQLHMNLIILFFIIGFIKSWKN